MRPSAPLQAITLLAAAAAQVFPSNVNFSRQHAAVGSSKQQKVFARDPQISTGSTLQNTQNSTDTVRVKQLSKSINQFRNFDNQTFGILGLPWSRLQAWSGRRGGGEAGGRGSVAEMLAHAFHGGPLVDIFSAQGTKSSSVCKTFGGVKKEYDKTVKGYVMELEGGRDVKMLFPPNDKESRN